MNDNEYDVKYDKTLYDLVADYWADYLKNKDREVVVKQKDDDNRVLTYSIPIVWFGNLKAYMASDLKVVTVGLNPSGNEFRDDKKAKQGQKGPFTFMRFSDDVKKLAGKELPEAEEDKKEAIKNLIRSYNKYFDNDPYVKWFDTGFGHVLDFFPKDDGLSVSYYKKDGKKNRAIHIDWKTALATEPTWSKMKSEPRKALSKKGINLLLKLLEYLNPHILLFSQGAQNYLPALLKTLGSNMAAEVANKPFETANKQNIKMAGYNIKGRLLIFQHLYCKNTPFGVGDDAIEKQKESFECILKKWKKRL